MCLVSVVIWFLVLSSLLLFLSFFLFSLGTRASVRQFSWSHDDGSTWSLPIISPFLGLNYKGGSCEGSTVALPESDENAGGKLVFATPFSTKARENMSLFVSDDSGATWQNSQQVYAGGSAYSALLGINSTHVGLVYEKDGYKTLNYKALAV